MTNLLSPSECGVRKHHLPLTAHGFIACDRSLYSHLWFTLCYLVPRVLPCREMGEEPEYEATVISGSHCVTLCYACRITNGPFDQEVISSSLTLEDPDLKVKESLLSDLSSQIVKRPRPPCVTREVTQSTRPSFSTDNLLRRHDLSLLFWYIFLCVGHFVLLHHMKKQEAEKDGMCDRPGR